MTGPFSLPASLPDPVAAAPASGSVAVDGFWPALDLDALRAAIRVDSVVTDARLRDVTVAAALEVAAELADWRAGQEALGHDALDKVPPRRVIADQGDYAILWTRAVQAGVIADLGDRQLGQSARAAGSDRVEQLSGEVDIARRDQRHAIRDFLGLPRIVAEAM